MGRGLRDSRDALWALCPAEDEGEMPCVLAANTAGDFSSPRCMPGDVQPLQCLSPQVPSHHQHHLMSCVSHARLRACLPDCRASRDLIYAALLRSMSPEHKFNSAAKLCGEVLAGVADGLLPLCECEEVLRDALCLMACKEIKVRVLVTCAVDSVRELLL